MRIRYPSSGKSLLSLVVRLVKGVSFRNAHPEVVVQRSLLHSCWHWQVPHLWNPLRVTGENFTQIVFQRPIDLLVHDQLHDFRRDN